jgi:hypothetical protein
MRFNNIAVVIRGHKRVWDYSKYNIFAFYEAISTNVDYYVSVWNTPSLDLQKMEKDFDGKNLIALVTPPLYEHFGGPWKSQSWLPYHILPYKTMREKTVTYDVVCDQRTDEMIYGVNYEFFDIQPNTLYSNFSPVIPYGPYRDTNSKTITRDLPVSVKPHVKDYGFMADSATYDLLTHRLAMHIKPRFEDSHELMIAQYLYENNITPVQEHVSQTCLVRPDICEYATRKPIRLIPREPSEVKGVVNSSFTNWQNLTLDTKRNLCSIYDIDPGDYFL